MNFIRAESWPNGSNNWVKRIGKEDKEATDVYIFRVVLLENFDRLQMY